MFDRTLINVNGVPYNVALTADRGKATVRRVDPDRGVSETWTITGQADFMLMLGHYKVSNPDAVARDFWLETE